MSQIRPTATPPQLPPRPSSTDTASANSGAPLLPPRDNGLPPSRKTSSTSAPPRCGNLLLASIDKAKAKWQEAKQAPDGNGFEKLRAAGHAIVKTAASGAASAVGTVHAGMEKLGSDTKEWKRDHQSRLARSDVSFADHRLGKLENQLQSAQEKESKYERLGEKTWQQRAHAQVEMLETKVATARRDRAMHDGPDGPKTKPVGKKSLSAQFGRRVASGVVNGAASVLGGAAAAMGSVANKARNAKDNYESTLAGRHVNVARESYAHAHGKFNKLDARHSSLQAQVDMLQTKLGQMQAKQLEALKGSGAPVDSAASARVLAKLEKLEAELAKIEPQWERASMKHQRARAAMEAHDKRLHGESGS